MGPAERGAVMVKPRMMMVPVHPISASRGHSKRRSAPKASDLRRLIKAVQDSGIILSRVEIEPDGKVVLIAAAPEIPGDALDQWLDRNASSA
jgi:hypothetical protein